MGAWLRDFKLAVRQFRLRPGLWFAIVLTLALGIGANAAVFHVFERLLLAPLPFPNADRLVFVYNTYPKNNLDYAGTSIPDYFDRVEQAKSLESIALYNNVGMNLTGEGPAERVRVQRTTPSFFPTLQVGPQLGRGFNDAEGEAGGDRVVVLTHELWQRIFGGRTDVLGRDLAINGESWRVIGVMPQGFGLPGQPADLYMPFQISAEQKTDLNRGHEFAQSIARLAPGASIEGVNAELDAIVKRNAERLPADFKQFFDATGFTGKARDMREFAVGDVGQTLATLQLATLLVLLIACANVANLLLAQNIARSKEFAVRNAIGAVRAHLIRQTLAETIVAALAGGVLGLLVAHGVLAILREYAGAALLLANVDAFLPWPTQVLTLLGGVVLVPLIAAIPVLLTLRTQQVSALKEGSRGNTGSGAAARARNGLVVAQLALSSALLVTAGLLLRSYVAAANESPGFSAEGVISAFVELPDTRYKEPADKVAFFDRALEKARAIPGVEQAGWVTGLPFTEFGWGQSYYIRGVEPADGMPPHTNVRMADPGYFDTVQIPLLKGRVFGAQDRLDSEPVVIIDELLARKQFGDRDPIGQYMSNNNAADTTWWRIIGVVGTVKTNSLDQKVEKETMYRPIAQFPQELATLVVRSPQDAQALTTQLRSVLQSADPGLAAFNIATLDSRIDDSLGIRRAPLVLVTTFAVIALLLAAIGLYAVLAFVVGRRVGEIGLRIAIGAQQSHVMRLVFAQGVRLLIVGLGLGLAIAVVSGRVIAAQLFGISALDPLTFVLVATALSAAALVACFAPAWRASRVDPMVCLRSE